MHQRLLARATPEPANQVTGERTKVSRPAPYFPRRTQPLSHRAAQFLIGGKLSAPRFWPNAAAVPRATALRRCESVPAACYAVGYATRLRATTAGNEMSSRQKAKPKYAA